MKALSSMYFFSPAIHRRILPSMLLAAGLGLARPAAPQTLSGLREALPKVSYEAERGGPLIVVAPQRRQRLPGNRNAAPSLRGLADAFDCRLMTIGSVTALVPRQMTLLNGDPGKPNLLQGLNPHQSLNLLLSLLTEEQWQKLGSENGIGFADLRDEQKPLLDALIPWQITVQRLKTVPNPESPNQALYQPLGEPKTGDRRAARLRINRRLSFKYESAQKAGEFHQYYTPPSPRFGDEFWRLEPSGNSPQTPENDPSRAALGVLLLPTAPNALKPGHLSFDTPALAARIDLTQSPGDNKEVTLGSLMDSIRAATRIDLRADRRLRDLPAYVRTAPGQRPRASDLLQALCWSVSGAFRRIDGAGAQKQAVFLLTQDVEGIGSRYARIAEWALQAEYQRSALLATALKTAASRKPLRFITFASDDPYALSPDLSDRIEKNWAATGGDSYLIETASLPEAVQDRIRREVGDRTGDGEPMMRADRVKLSATSNLTLVLPGIGVLTENTSANSFLAAPTEAGNLQHLLPPAVSDPAERPRALTSRPASQQRPAVFLPVKQLKRRVLLISAGKSPEAAGQIVSAARSRGFTEVWLQLPTAPVAKETLAFLTAAVRAGKTAGIPVGASLSLLQPVPFWEAQETPIASPNEERNIRGETGAEFVARLDRDSPAREATGGFGSGGARWKRLRYRGWVTPKETALRQMAAAVAGVPGLSGILFRAAVPPGFAPVLVYATMGILPSGEMGYTPEARLAFLAKEGIDPIDIPAPYQGGIRITQELPFFPLHIGEVRMVETEPNRFQSDRSQVVPIGPLWNKFRQDRSRQILTGLWKSVRASHPKLPLYIGNPASGYDSPTRSWYQSWDAAETLPKDQSGPGEGIRAAVRRTSRAALFSIAEAPPANADASLSPSLFARRSSLQWDEPLREGWDGMVLDVSYQLPSRQLELIRGFAEAGVSRSGTQ